jgi:hypothetical protein
MVIQLVAKLRDEEWRAATILDNVFQDANVNSSLANVIGEALGPTMSQEFPEGTTFSLTVVVDLPKEN